MPELDFNNSLKVDEKDLIPLEPQERCLWVKDVMQKSYDFGLYMKRKGREDTRGIY